MSVALVLVSHSAELARGLAELCQQMAPDVAISPVGGDSDGGLGTSYDAIDAAVRTQLDAGYEVLVMTDLGSATMTVEVVLDDYSEGVRLADAPFVEGSVAAAVAAQQGSDLAGVESAAVSSIEAFRPPAAAAVAEDAYQRTVVVRDADGLHARPAAVIAEMAAAAEDGVQLNGVDAESALLIMTLGLLAGDEVTVSGADREVVDRIAEAIAAGID
ncbi:dihydroxyacetone kinase phosphoryl donor subunit DhaM [Corynebacterium uterequi]|uniref:Phosphocarrier protein HPr n=1 Tax=Corynebacterium uterequi TaxID=1072256 RepID=A0A0G3HDZ0_9CORY|nr:dihydroxyacetone kinase phosphoryl donor subunit DhaM [Corynebacterium uterequi]AKK10945.1 dihydroxyacetone kinase DhaM subunit; Phosphocarrier protein HPr [Corynebacterium uterequi]